MNSSGVGEFRNCGTDFSTDLTVINFKYYCDGLLVSVLGCLGIIGNLISLVVLARPKLRDCFHQLLLALAVCDILYICCGGVKYTFNGFEVKKYNAFTLAMPIIYPFTNITMNGTIFMTTAISIERFLGICFPLHLPPHNRKSWFYILPVILLSFSINIPKFLEGEIRWYPEADSVFFNLELNRTELKGLVLEQESLSPSVPAYLPTELRKGSNYIKYYRTYFRLFSTAVIPFLVLIVINTRIILELFHMKPMRFGSQRKLWKEINMFLVLLCIVVIFICCHVPRVIIDIWEFCHVEDIVQCNDLTARGEGHPFHPPKWIECLVHTSHFSGILSSSTNFLIYCFIGHTFRRECCQLLGVRRRGPLASEAQATMSRKSSVQGSSYHAVSCRVSCKEGGAC